MRLFAEGVTVGSVFVRFADIRQPKGAPIVDGATCTRVTYTQDHQEIGRIHYGGVAVTAPGARRSLFIGRRSALLAHPSSWWWLPLPLRRMR